MIPVYFRKKNDRKGQPTPESVVRIFWPGDHSQQDFFGNQLTVQRAKGVKLLTEADFGDLLSATLEFLRLLKSFNLQVITKAYADDLSACEILDTQTDLRNLRESYEANLILVERAFKTDTGESTDNPGFYLFKRGRTRLWLQNRQAIRLSNNILAKLPSGGNAVRQFRQALGLEIQGEELVAIMDDQSKLKVTETKDLCFILNRPFLGTGELALNFIKALTKALYISEVFPDLKDKFLVNVEGVLLDVGDFISVFDVSTLLQMLGVNIDLPPGLGEGINFRQPETFNNLPSKDARVVRKTKISIKRAKSIYASEDLDLLNKQWVAAVSYLILYLQLAKGYLVGCEIEISSGKYFTRLPSSGC